MMSCNDITYCIPATPCANTECPRHRTHAPINMVGVSAADLWATCATKKEYKQDYPVHKMNAA